MDEIHLPDAIEPTEWNVVFHTKTQWWWLRWVGKFKHVSAFAYVPGFRAWLVYDTQLSGTRLMLLANGDNARATLKAYTTGCEIVTMARQGQSMGIFNRFGYYCVPSVKHLIGLKSTAILPDRLFADCLRSGQLIVKPKDAAP